MLSQAATAPGVTAIRMKRRGRWEELTRAGVADGAALIGAGLHASGVRRGEVVAVLADNSPTWLMADLGAQGVGAACVGVDPSGVAGQVAAALTACRAVAVLVEDEEQLDKVVEVRPRLNHLRLIVVMNRQGFKGGAVEGIVTLDELRRLGAPSIPTFLQLVSAVDLQCTAVLSPRPSAPGEPSFETLTHDAVLELTCAQPAAIRRNPDVEEVLVLGHLGGRLHAAGLLGLLHGHVLNFAEQGGDRATDMRELQPTVVCAAAGTWEQMFADVEVRLSRGGRLARNLVRLRLERCSRAENGDRKRAGRAYQALGVLGWVAIERPLRKQMGLLRLRRAVVTDGRVAADARDFFASLGVTLHEHVEWMTGEARDDSSVAARPTQSESRPRRAEPT